jgi:hypothetical protein
MHLKRRKSSCHLNASCGRRFCHDPKTGIRLILLFGQLGHPDGNLDIKAVSFSHPS